MRTRRLPAFLAALGLGLTTLATPAAAELFITNPPGTGSIKDDPLHLGGALTIRATGTHATEILSQVSDTANRTFTLYLNGVQIPGLAASYVVTSEPDPKAPTPTPSPTPAPATPSASAGATAVDLTFYVTRNSQDPASRDAWNTLLRPMEDFQSLLTVALAVGPGNPQPVGRVAATGPAVLAFQAPARLMGGYLAGVLMLAFCVGLLILWPHMLRERSDPRYAFSLARTQMAIWGIIVIACFTGVIVAMGTLEHIPAQTLILMGISATTGLSARLIDSGNPPVPKSLRPGIKGFFDDLCISDSGASFHRVQVLLWTLVLGCYFVKNVCDVISMPEFPETLLILLGISNGTYLGFKTQETPPAPAPAPVQGNG